MRRHFLTLRNYLKTIKVTDVLSSISSLFPEEISIGIVSTLKNMETSFQTSDHSRVVAEGGRFVEFVLRGLEYLRTGTDPIEIKHAANTADKLRSDSNLEEALRLTIPRILLGSIYELRNKRDGVHVKRIAAERLDANQSLSSAKWVVAELLRVADLTNQEEANRLIDEVLSPLFPNLQHVMGERAFTKKLSCRDEVLSLLADSHPLSLTRKCLVKETNYKGGSIDHALSSLKDKRVIHQLEDNSWVLLRPGFVLLKESL